MEDLPARDDAVGAVIAAQKRLGRALHRPYANEWIHLDLSMGQLKTLMALASHQPATVSELADTLEVGKPTASVLVDRLVQLGYAARAEDPEDRRRTLVTTTAAGSDLVTSLRQGHIDRMVRWLEAIAPDDLDALTRGLEALVAVAEHDIESDLTSNTAAS